MAEPVEVTTELPVLCETDDVEPAVVAAPPAVVVTAPVAESEEADEAPAASMQLVEVPA